MQQTLQSESPRTMLRCVLCGKLYEPGQRIEVVNAQDGKVVHLECKSEKDGNLPLTFPAPSHSH